MISCSRLLFLQQRRWSAWWKVAANKCVRSVSPVFISFNLCKCVMPYCCRTVFYVQESEGSLLHWVSLEAPVINSGNCTWESQTCLFARQENATGYKGILETTGWEMMPDNTSPSGHILGEFFAYLTCDGPQKYMHTIAWKRVEKQNQVLHQAWVKAKMISIHKSALLNWDKLEKHIGWITF